MRHSSFMSAFVVISGLLLIAFFSLLAFYPDKPVPVGQTATGNPDPLPPSHTGGRILMFEGAHSSPDGIVLASREGGDDDMCIWVAEQLHSMHTTRNSSNFKCVSLNEHRSFKIHCEGGQERCVQ